MASAKLRFALFLLLAGAIGAAAAAKEGEAVDTGAAVYAGAAAYPGAAAYTGAAADLETIKQAALALNRDLLLLEEELLFPASTQVIVYVAMDVGEFFALEAVRLMVDDKLVASYLYTDDQTTALFRGGYQRLYVGNVKAGEHEVTAFFTGKGPAGRDLQRAASLTFAKDQRASVIELRIVDSAAKQQPLFEIKQWYL